MRIIPRQCWLHDYRNCPLHQPLLLLLLYCLQKCISNPLEYVYITIFAIWNKSTIRIISTSILPWIPPRSPLNFHQLFTYHPLNISPILKTQLAYLAHQYRLPHPTNQITYRRPRQTRGKARTDPSTSSSRFRRLSPSHRDRWYCEENRCPVRFIRDDW